MVQEGQLLAVFNSAHRVMKAEHLLKAANLAVLLIPAPRALSTDCGLALRFSPDLEESVMQNLQQQKLLPAFICRYNGNNSYTTIWSEQIAITTPQRQNQ